MKIITKVTLLAYSKAPFSTKQEKTLKIKQVNSKSYIFFLDLIKEIFQ